MNIEKMNKKDAVNVYMINHNYRGEITGVALIATFRNKNWAEAFVKMETESRPDTYCEYCELYIDIERRYS